MRNNYRTKTDVVASILSAVNDRPLGKTRLMYTAMISSAQTREYLSELLSKGFLFYDPVIRTYHTTQQGKEYLVLHEKMRRLSEE